MKYFKIIHGYNKDEYLEITEDELPKAFALFLEGQGRGIFESGAIRGQDIMGIDPDWHRECGFNRFRKLDQYDWEQIEPKQKQYRKTLLEAKSLALTCIKEDKRELLSQPFTQISKEDLKQLTG
jgi:hypothetical protein